MGIFYAILSSIIFGFEPTIRNLALQKGISAEESLAITSTINFLVVILIRKLYVEKKPLKKTTVVFRLKMIAAGAVGNGLTGICLSKGYQYMPVGCATSIHYLYPTLVCIVMCICFHKRINIFHGMGMLFSVFGIILIAGKTDGITPLGFILVFLSSITYTVYTVFVDRSINGKVGLIELIMYSESGTLIISYILWISNGNWFTPSLMIFGILAFSAVIALVGNFLFITAIKKIGGTMASFFGLLEPLTSIIVSTLFFHYNFKMATKAGFALVISSILFISFGNHLTTNKNSLPDTL